MALLLALPAASAAESFVILVDWTPGEAAVGSTRFLMSPLAQMLPFTADACPRLLLVDLLYEPAGQSVDVEGVGSAGIAYEFLVESHANGTRLHQTRVGTSGYGHVAGITLGEGAHEVHVSLANGALVGWDVRVRGQARAHEPACQP